MISLKEILMGRVEFKDLPPEHQSNIMILLERINKIRSAYGKPMKVNDGYRRPQDKPKNGATQSTHFRGAGIDIDDDDAGTLWKWVFANRKLLKEVGLWCEHPSWTHCDGMSWLHFQIVPPGSGKRFYVPSTRPNPNPSFWDGKYEAELDSKEQPK
jgi:hypothetical protein